MANENVVKNVVESVVINVVNVVRQSTTIYDNLRQLRQFTTIYMRQSLTDDEEQIRAQQFNLLAYSHQELLYLSLHDVVHSGR